MSESKISFGTNHNIINYGTNEPHRTSSPSLPGSAFIYANLPVGPPIPEINDHEARQGEVQPTMPERSKLRYVILFLFAFVLCIAIMGCISLSLAFVFYNNAGDGPAISYSVFCGLFFIILIFVAAPSSLVLCFQPNSEPRSFCSAKCTLYVAVFLAATFMLTGASFAGILQIFFTTQCSNSMVPIGSIFSVLNLFIATLCIFVAIFIISTCFKDRSRKSSNLCVGVFFLQVLIFNSETVAFFLSLYTYISIFVENFPDSIANKIVLAFVLAGVVITALLLCSCIIGPILCILDSYKHRHFNKVGGIYFTTLSIGIAGGINIIAAILMFVSTPSLTASSVPDTTMSYYGCYPWHPRAILALSLISGFMHFVVTCVGLFSVCFRCKYLRASYIVE